MPRSDDAHKLHQKLLQKWNSKDFEPKIRHIRFFNFKNLAPNLRINFDHPITALVGPNGTNKTSILRALQGCPENENIGRYWFGTALDRTPGRNRPRFIYGRWSEQAQDVVEMLKMRVRRADNTTGELDPDYWEPAESNLTYEMTPMPPFDAPGADRTEDRWALIVKDVVYLDFRSEVSAYDKYFFHHEYRRRTKDRGSNRVDVTKRRKNLIRDNSKKLRTILDQQLDRYMQGGTNWVLKAPRQLSGHELYWIGRILLRSYASITVLEHRAFQVDGFTAILHTDQYEYSEAWAGSGEFAAIQLVTAIIGAKPKSLILLDEPEVSLYPAAQQAVMDFLSAMADKYQHQIVLATHSPVLIDQLPPKALKVLEIDRETGSVQLRSQESAVEEAFAALGHRFEKKTVVVEDALAREIVLRALRARKPNLLGVVDIAFHPGGESVLRQRDLPSWARHKEDHVLLMLDGDVLSTDSEPEPATVRLYQVLNADGIVGAANDIAPSDKETIVDTICGLSNVMKDSGDDAERDLDGVLDWCNRYFRFFPGTLKPEVWLYTLASISWKGPDEAVPGTKEWWAAYTSHKLQLAESENGPTSSDILGIQRLELAKLSSNHPDVKKIAENVSQFLEL